MSDNAIQCERLTRDFGAIRALDSLSMEVPAGIIFGFLGPNGSGKTTAIRLLLGLLEPTYGRAEVLGYDTGSQAGEIRLRTGALLEFPGLYERLSAEDNLEFYGRVWRLAASERRSRIQELLTHLDLWDRRKETAGTWSRGMKQKLAIARALIHRPGVIFLDEPTAGLDPMASVALHNDLTSLAKREGVTVFLTTHNLAEAEKLCGQVGVIRQGKLLAVGGPDELRSRVSAPRVSISGHGFGDSLLQSLTARPEVAEATLQNGQLLITLRGEAETAPLISLIVSMGAAIEEVHKDKASLEEVFMQLMEEDH